MRALLIDSESSSRQNTAQVLAKERSINRVDECDDCLAAAQLLARSGIDVIILRVGIEELTGIEDLLRLPRSRLPRFAFLFDDDKDLPHELKTTDGIIIPMIRRHSVVDDLTRFLVEAADSDAEETGARTHEQLRFIIEHCGSAGSDNGDARRLYPFLQRILIKSGSDSKLIAADAIDWVESADHYVYLHSSGKSHLLYATMNGLEDQLPPGRFIRAHRGAIVNLDSVEKVTNGKYGTLVLTLADGTEVRVSRSRREEVRRSLH